MSKVSIKEIRDRYLSSKEKEKEFKWTYYVRRPVSYYAAWPFLRMGISATHVTIIWLIVAAIGCLYIASGSYQNMLIGTILLEAAVILDCVDGHIARFTRPTRTGDILDTWVGEILLVSSLFSIGIGLSNNPDLAGTSKALISQFTSYEPHLFTILGFFGGLAALCSWTVRLHWRTIAQKLALENYEPDQTGKSRKTVIVDNLFHYSGAITMVMVISALFGVMDVALVLITVVYGGYLLMIMSRIIKRARALDRAV